MKDAGALLKKLDPYDHPRTTMAAGTSAALAGDGWMNVLTYGSTDQNVGSVEHQFYQLPAVNAGIQSQQDLWNATMNGQYPASGSGAYMKAWAEFMAGNRYWELEPYFDVDGGRALALEGVEYIVYVEKPGLVELTVENHSYDVVWMNPATGELIKQKDYKGEHFTGEPPDKSHDWVLRVSREGHKAGMLKSYKFDSRPVPVQEVELNPLKIPFEIAAPGGYRALTFKAGPVRGQDQARQPGHSFLVGRMDRGSPARWRRLPRGGNRQGRNARHTAVAGEPLPGGDEPAHDAAQRQRKGVRAGSGVQADPMSLHVLAIDTTGDVGSIALVGERGLIEEVTLDSPDGFVMCCSMRSSACWSGTA